MEQAVEYGNIVVLVQYRLGIMGFFHYQDTNGVTHGGNYGLADMALGVKFIAENASKLGGDSEHIMINGESAGSGSVMALLLHDETGKSKPNWSQALSGRSVEMKVDGALKSYFIH